jgi:hypothetical protein
MPFSKLSLGRVRYGLLAGLLLVLASLPAFCLTLPVAASGLNNRSWQLLNDAPGATTDYATTFTFSNSSTIGSLNILLCSNSPLQDDVCALPLGLDVTNAQLTAQSGITDFSLFVAATNDIVLSRTPAGITAPLTVSLTLHNIINPSAAGSYYVRLSAYSSNNATGSPVDFGGLAFAIANNLQISSVVPPYLTFCTGLTINAFDCSSAAGDYINFGELSTAHSSHAASQMVVATNAPNGYVIQVYGTTMTSGNNTIGAITNLATSRVGTSQFGINLRANTNPAVGTDPTGPGTGEPSAAYNSPNHYQFVSNDTVANSLTADDFRKYTASYIVNISNAQPPGVYASTLTYVSAGSF